MKIRQGFVSNSSSSSFLVFFPDIPKDVEEVYHYIWDNNKNINSIQKSYKFDIPGEDKKKLKNFHDYNSVGMTFEKFQESAADTVWRDIQNQSPGDYLRIICSLMSGDSWMDDDDCLYMSHYGIANEERFKEKYRNVEELEEDIEINK